MTQQPIHQLVHTLSYGDAISTEVLALQRSLRAHGVESEIFSINEHPKLKGCSKKYTSLDNSSKADLILHYSLGSPLTPLYASWSGGRKILIYHNITPASWFQSINARVASDIEEGLRELPEICKLSDLILADSQFNASELVRYGVTAKVLPLLVDPSRWALPRNEGIYSLVKGTPGFHLLHVGRLAPNKCIEDIIKVFYFFYHHVAKSSTGGVGSFPSQLWLVGIDTDTELYSFSLRRLVDELGLQDAVTFAGCMADEEVRALYESCSAYLCMSEHEGFCLPVIEAMHFKLPVVAYDTGAVSETIGSGGIIVKEKRHAQIAELLADLLPEKNSSLRNRMIDAGQEEGVRFSFERFSDAVKATLLTANDPLIIDAEALKVAPLS